MVTHWQASVGGAGGMNHQAALNWDDVVRFKETFPSEVIPLIIKYARLRHKQSLRSQQSAVGREQSAQKQSSVACDAMRPTLLQIACENMGFLGRPLSFMSTTI